MTRFCIGCKNDWCLSADGTSHDTGSSIVGCTAWPHDEVAECPCEGRACDDLPGGPLPGCPYRVATKGLTHFVPRTEENADASQAPETSLLKNGVGKTPTRTAEVRKACSHCASEAEPGWIETDNNGPIVRCGICNGTGLSHLRTEPASPLNQENDRG